MRFPVILMNIQYVNKHICLKVKSDGFRGIAVGLHFFQNIKKQ